MKDPAHVAAGRIGALRLHGTHDSRQLTTNGRAAFLKKFRDQAVAADPELATALTSDDAEAREAAEREVERRAAYLRQAYFSKLAWNREKARKKKAATSLDSSSGQASEASAHATDAA